MSKTLQDCVDEAEETSLSLWLLASQNRKNLIAYYKLFGMTDEQVEDVIKFLRNTAGVKDE